MKFNSGVSKNDLILRYGLKRSLCARDDYENGRYNSLLWIFVADYCKDNHLNPYCNENYNNVKELFFKLLEGV